MTDIAENQAPSETQALAPPTRDESRSMLWFLSHLEGGAFMANATEALAKLNEEMNDHAATHGSKAKGKITIEVNLALERGVFEIEGVLKVKAPSAAPDSTIMWSTPTGGFSLEHPKQLNMFRDIGQK